MGCRLVRHLSGKHDVFAPSHNEMDICNRDSVTRIINDCRPDAVIHCAALSNTWYCEQHPEESYNANVMATLHIAEACADIGAKLIFISSDQVYNGTPLSGPLPEDAPLEPVNHYGRHKLLAERKVMEVLPSAVGLRLTWMYDRPDSPLKLNPNILVNLAKAGAEGGTVKAAPHEHRGMTNVMEVVGNIGQCLAVPGGIYNFGSGNPFDSYHVFRECARMMGLPDGTVIPDEERFRDMPRNLVMDPSKIEKQGIRFPDTLEGLFNTINN